MNARQHAFVAQYLVDMNATQAAIRAGYSPRTAGSQAHDLLKKPEIWAALEDGIHKLAELTETSAVWVRRRLKEEAMDFSENASHSARIRAIELLAKLDGMFALENKQRTDPITELLRSLSGNVIGPVENACTELCEGADNDD